ncbi:MAG: MFS transporter, partial [Microbacterium sp.]
MSEARAARGVGWGALLVGTAVMSGIYAPQPLLAEVAAEFDRTAFEANLVVSMTTLGIALGVFPMAAISARAGRGRTIAWGLAASFLLTLATAVVSAWPVLVAVRMLMGIASSAVLVSAVVWATESVPALWGRRAAGLYVAGTTAGGMLGRLVAGIVADAWGWRAGLVVVDAAVLVTAV